MFRILPVNCFEDRFPLIAVRVLVVCAGVAWGISLFRGLGAGGLIGFLFFFRSTRVSFRCPLFPPSVRLRSKIALQINNCFPRKNIGSKNKHFKRVVDVPERKVVRGCKVDYVCSCCPLVLLWSTHVADAVGISVSSAASNQAF